MKIATAKSLTPGKASPENAYEGSGYRSSSEPAIPRSDWGMVSSLYEADKLGACCWIVDPLTLIWNELLDSFKQKLGYIPIDKWQDIRQLWNGDYIRYFLNCGMNCPALGRLGNDFAEREETLKNGETKTKLVKVGTKFKAGAGKVSATNTTCCSNSRSNAKTARSTGRSGRVKAAWSTAPTCSRTEPGH